jgi:PTH1 family peptidyl-tRNA hydrolase
VKLIVGLGNPGPRYRDTYHNVGFEVADELARRHRVEFSSSPADAVVARVRGLADDVMIVKPLTFMNLSGRAVGDLVRFYKVAAASDVLIVVDDVALPTGRLRVRARGSAGGHNGLRSIIEGLGTEEFPRLRVGVGRGDPGRTLKDHVLARVAADDRATLREAALKAADAAEAFVASGLAAAMNEYNREPAPDASDPE